MKKHTGIRLSSFLLFIAIVAAWAGLARQAQADPDGVPAAERIPLTEAPADRLENTNFSCHGPDNTVASDCLTIKWGDYRYWFLTQGLQVYVAAYDHAGNLVAYKLYEEDYSIYDAEIDDDARTITLYGFWSDLTTQRIQFSWDDLTDMLSVVRPKLSIVYPPEGHLENQASNFTLKAEGVDHIPTGTVTVRHGDDEWGTADLEPDGTVSVAAPSLKAGRYFLTVGYSGDDRHYERTALVPLIVSRDASDGGPRVNYLPYSAAPDEIPGNSSLQCWSFGDSGAFETDCPVVEWEDHRFWFFEENANGVNMTVAAYDADGRMLGSRSYSAERDLYDLYIREDWTVEIYGQYHYYGYKTVTVPWSDLVSLTGGYATTVTLDLSAGTIAEGDDVTLTATVKASATNPTGEVVFRNRGEPLHAPVELDGDGTALLTVPNLPAGRHYLTAEYTGDDEHRSETSQPMRLIVSRDASDGGPTVVYLPESDPPDETPDHVMTFCFSDAELTSHDDCPVIEWGDYVFWVYNAEASGYALTVAAYDLNGKLIGSREYAGLRYLYEITVNPAAENVTLWGQANQKVTIDWDTLAEIAKMTWTALTLSDDAVEAGETVTLTASVEGLSGTPTGTVEIVERDGKLDAAAVPLGPDGTAVLELEEPEEGEYTFTAVYSGDGSNSASKSGAVTLTVAPLPVFTVEFVSDGEVIESRSVAKNATITDPPAPAKTGHELEGWYIDEAFGSRWSFEDDAVTEDLRLYAKWTPLTFRLDYAAGAGGRIVGDASQTVEYGKDGSSVTAEPDPGYHFVQWSDGKTDAARKETNVAADLSVTALFDRNSYPVVFHSNGGSGVPAQTVPYGGKAAEPDEPVKAGRLFGGWYLDNGTFGQAWDFARDTVPVGGVELYAKWILPAPDAPVLKSATPGDRQVRLAWHPAPGAESYIIHVSTTQGEYGMEAGSVSASVYEYVVTGLTNGTAYYFTAAARNPGGTAYSNTLTAVPLAPPAAPANVRAEAGNGLAVVRFDPPADDGGSPIVKYVVADPDGNVLAEGAASPIEVAGLTNGQTYSFVVHAVNAAGRGPDSDASNAVTPAAPSVGNPGGDDPQDPGDGNNDDDDGPNDPGDGGNDDDDEPIDPGDGGNDDDDEPNDPGDGGNDDDDKPINPGGGNAGGQGPISPDDEAGEQARDHVAIVLVNGRPVGVEIDAVTADNGRQAIAFALEPERMDALLAEEEPGAVITIRAMTSSPAAVWLNGRMVKDMARREAAVRFVTDAASYTMPARLMPIDELAQRFGPEAALQDIRIAVEIAAAADGQRERIERALRGQGHTLAAPPVQFTVRAEYGGSAVEVAVFGGYVERTIAIPEGADPGRITTAVVVEPDGTVRHVPTKIMETDGRMAAVIHSLTNSVYALVLNPVQFADVSGHWAEAAILEMGARMIVRGTGGGFEPDRPMTRAEFAAVIVRALGLEAAAPDDGELPFRDVKRQDWFSEAARTASAYGLVSGTGGGEFRPGDPITREQAMVIMAKAMAITGLEEQIGPLSDERALGGYRDADRVSAWARREAALNLQAGIVFGRNGAELAPQAVITRAEAASMAQRLLQRSGLI